MIRMRVEELLAVLIVVAGMWGVMLLASVHRIKPEKPEKGACQIYETHHGDSTRSYQLTCSLPVPDSITVYPARTR